MNVSFVLFRCRKWLEVVGDEELLYIHQDKLAARHVCCKHFKPEDMRQGTKKTLLHMNAVPSIFEEGKKPNPLPEDLVSRWPMLIQENVQKTGFDRVLEKAAPNPNPQATNPSTSTSRPLQEVTTNVSQVGQSVHLQATNSSLQVKASTHETTSPGISLLSPDESSKFAHFYSHSRTCLFTLMKIISKLSDLVLPSRNDDLLCVI